MARRLTLMLGTDGGVTRAVSVGAVPTFSVFAPRVSGVVSRQGGGGFPTTGALVNHPLFMRGSYGIAYTRDFVVSTSGFFQKFRMSAAVLR